MNLNIFYNVLQEGVANMPDHLEKIYLRKALHPIRKWRTASLIHSAKRISARNDMINHHDKITVIITLSIKPIEELICQKLP
jgi:hypothetical protein